MRSLNEFGDWPWKLGLLFSSVPDSVWPVRHAKVRWIVGRAAKSESLAQDRDSARDAETARYDRVEPVVRRIFIYPITVAEDPERILIDGDPELQVVVIQGVSPEYALKAAERVKSCSRWGIEDDEDVLASSLSARDTQQAARNSRRTLTVGKTEGSGFPRRAATGVGGTLRGGCLDSRKPCRNPSLPQYH